MRFQTVHLHSKVSLLLLVGSHRALTSIGKLGALLTLGPRTNMRHITSCICQLEELRLDPEDRMSVYEVFSQTMNHLRLEPLVIETLFIPITPPFKLAVPSFSFILALRCIFSISLPW